MVRFWKHVDRRGPDECWEWQGRCDPPTGKTTKGYGYFAGFGRMKVGAHVFAYELERGEVGRGRVVMHTCDNPPCCNPAHLVIGTPADNMRDRLAKGHYPRGMAHHNSKLTEEAVKAIRSRYAMGEKQVALAAEFGVGQQTISRVVNGRDWDHVE